MRQPRFWKRILLSAGVAFGGGTAAAGGCLDTIASVNVCGTVLTFCTPADQLNVFFPFLTTPDYFTDPSCTIPLGCGTGDLYQNIPAGFPGGSAPQQPTNSQTGSGAGGGGGI